MIGLVLLAGISGLPAFAATNVANTSTKPTVVTNNPKPQPIISYGSNHPTATVGKWKLDKTKAKLGYLTPAEKTKFDVFQDAIANQGMSPKDAAKKISNAKYELVNQKSHQYQISLGKHKLATFFVDNANHKVTISQVGGQTNSPFAIRN